MKPDGKFTVGTNTKLGSKVGSLNKVPVETCPGSTPWCEDQCYARKGNFNMWMDEYGSQIDMPEELPEKVRLHASGDFDTPEYVDWCKDLVSDNPDTVFWAYTRSWRVDSLFGKLEELRKLNNMTLFASMDRSIEESPPEDWRVSWIENDPRKSGIKCGHDKGVYETCSECGYCYNGIDKDIIFELK